MDTGLSFVTHQALVARFLPPAMAASSHVVLVKKIVAELTIEYCFEYFHQPSVNRDFIGYIGQSVA
jgi:hypothetical protein